MNCRMMAVGMCCTCFIERNNSQPMAGPTTRLPATASRNAGRHCRCREAAGGGGADGEPIDQQRARVVQQALAFENRQQPMWRVQRPQHRGRGDGVRRRDDGAEGDRGGPGHRRDQCVRDERDGCGRQSHGKDDQAEDGRPVVPEVPERRVVCGIE